MALRELATGDLLDGHRIPVTIRHAMIVFRQLQWNKRGVSEVGI